MTTVWALGDYPSVASQVIPELGAVLASAIGAGPGQRVLDVAAGSGNAAIPAALAGADVTASDVTPELLEVGAEEAARRAARVSWEVGDAQALPYPDGAFDAVMSCVGVMFAPDHAAAGRELVRVCRPGGRIGLISWTPDGFVGQMFATMRPYAPAPPAGALPPPLWGDAGHVTGLLGDAVSEVTTRRAMLRVTAFDSGPAFRDFFKARYGPAVAVYARHADDPERTAALDRDLDALADRSGVRDGVMEWEYLLLTAIRN